MPTEKEALAQAAAAMDTINTQTTRAATAVTTIQGRIQTLLDQIAASDNLAAAQDLADKAGTQAAALTGVADALEAMANPANGGGVINPVPVPVPTA